MTLEQLAATHGVATSYDNWAGERVQVSREAVTSALAALGVDASDDHAVEAALRDAQDAPWLQPLPPVVVIHQGRPGKINTVEVVGEVLGLQLQLEDGRSLAVENSGIETARRDGRVRQAFALPDLPLGYHHLVVRTSEELAQCPLIVVPARLELAPGRHWGWQIQLYAMRSRQSWGIGDYRDLRTIVEAAAADGAGALLVNPLHAETPVLPIEPSPYSPSSRLFRSALALRIQDIPEYERVRDAVEALRPDTEGIDRDAAWTAKLAALELMWPHHREGELVNFRTERGQPLERFALFCALAEQHGPDWTRWPEHLQTPDALPVGHEERVSFWCWVQLLVDEQLAGIAAGMGVGVLHDLAVGVSATGADAWALQDVLALGTSVGAPPDSFNQKGQDWGLPPWRPDRLRAAAYEPFREMVRGVLRHAGGIRIDHVMGLSRLWWVPAGSDASDGTYVSGDAEAMIGVLALEAHRAGAIVVGEDLGTVEPALRTSLDSTGVLGSAVLWFETRADGSYVPPAQWKADALASVTTHDLPTAAGWAAHEHVRVRHELGLLGHSLEQEQARADAEREQLLAMLRAEGLLDDDLTLSLHRALVASPCRIVLAAYGDAVGDVRQPNLPGMVDEYPSWRLPVCDGNGRPLALEELLVHPGVRRLTAVLSEVT